MTLKPGDQVWVGPLTLDEYGEAEWYDGDDERLAHDQSAIPDIPHINTICRYLADHPETVDALEGLGNWITQDQSWPALYGLIAAMRGEGGE